MPKLQILPISTFLNRKNKKNICFRKSIKVLKQLHEHFYRAKLFGYAKPEGLFRASQ
jgi:hypothetical protein